MVDITSIEAMLNKMSEEDITDRIKILKDKNLYIYGAGSFGCEINNLLCNNDIYIKAFLDISADKIIQKHGVKVLHPLEKDICKDEDTVVLFAIVMDKDTRKNVINFIKSCGFNHIIEAQSLRCYLVGFRENYNKEIYLKDNKNQIIEAFTLWADDKSRHIYKQNLCAHLNREYSNCYRFEDNMDKQYFPEDIQLNKGYETFIDCGGFIGDTVEQLEKREDVKLIISFEPNLGNFKNLSITCERINKATFLYPCAVSSESGFTSFSGEGGSGTICLGGENLVQSVSLDMVLKNIKPTFIKMDIEGAEIQALKGAEGILRKYAPDLAICVYHYISDLWEIPILIKRINNNYKLYLRSYNACTMETVLYATV